MNAEVNENLQSSALAQRLRQRVVESPGVINLRQLPAQHTQSAANTIIQRYNLSDRIQSRYNSAPIFQPTGIAHLFQRSRAEAFSTLDTPLSSPSVRGNGESGIGNWELGIGNGGTSPPHPVTFSPSPGTFRVSRRLSPETTQSNFEPSLTETSSGLLSTQNPGEISPSDAMLVSPSVADAIAASPPALESPSERVRVQHLSRSNTSIQRVSIPQSDRADTPMGTSDNSIQSQSSLDLPLQRVSLPNRTTQPNAAIDTASNTTSEATTATPITLIQRQSQPTSIARVTQHLESNASVRSHSAPPENIASGQSVIPKPINSMPLVVARVPLNRETTQTSDTLSTQEQGVRHTVSPLPLRVPATSSSSLGLQRQSQEGTAVTFGSAQTNAQDVGYVNTTESRSHQPPVQTTDSASRSVLQNIPATSQPEMVWRKPSAESIPSALPIRENGNSAIIARQTLLEASPALESVPPTSTTTTTSTAETAASGNTNTVDIQQIAEQVSRILTRQLTVERERRGMGRW